MLYKNEEPLKVPLGVHKDYIPLTRMPYRLKEKNVLALFWDTMDKIKKNRSASAFSVWLEKEKDYITRTKQKVINHGAVSEAAMDKLMFLVSRHDQFEREQENKVGKVAI